MQTFYNRELHLKKLRDISNTINHTKGQLSVIVGRRRVGKTRLINEAFSQINHQYIYLFISRKSEQTLVDEFTQIIKNTLDAPFFHPKSLKDILEFILYASTKQPLTLVIDEFQDIEKINKGLFSDIQNLWDNYKNKSQIHLVCCGSLYSLMNKIFKGDKQPLLNRDDYYIKVQPLQPSYIKKILEDLNAYTPENMLKWWCLSGGIPKYIEWLAQSPKNVFKQLINESSPLINEGLHRLVEDFGAEHKTYFDILSAISIGYTSRPKIESYLNIGVGTSLNILETEFEIIKKHKPITAKANSRDIRYSIADPFLRFWFKFIHSNRSAIEIENFEYIYKLVNRDYETYSGIELEALFKAILIESKRYNRIGQYWDRKGENEIDIIAIDDLNKRALFVEVKRQKKRYNPNVLINKSTQVINKLNLTSYTIDYQCYSLDNLTEIIEAIKVES